MSRHRLRAAARPLRLRSLAPVLLLALAAPALAGCADDGRAEPASDRTSGATSAPSLEPSVGTGEYPRYVALGDSYTAAPLVPETDAGDGCLRSSGNYPSLVAAAFKGTVLADVSCSGADTTSLIGVQRTFDGAAQPAQLDAVTEDTSLVTLSIGGNDFGLFSALVGGCAQLAQTDPDGSPCADVGAGEATEVLAKIEQRVASVVEGIRDRAPDARILVVGYPQIVPQGKETCDALPIAAGDLPFARTVNEGLAEAVEEGARRAKVEYVDVYALTDGHDICSDDPWIAGRDTVPGQALAFHPFAAEQQAVAEEILRILRD
ncbi:SGNH/GDSL hydrolase family protein [uncultured Nocardioides sp.]|jgi:lysophospholipase L1-like esterase|uniref:SGNH/GDSL hydrolase family protein n=1 Tax=uncultured Nocardioides sp. TaxID=198441 RepID=UPI0026098905|nr:SGNH/GDSL hydrolase family protein [uncultured Nocardioides sp.]